MAKGSESCPEGDALHQRLSLAVSRNMTNHLARRRADAHVQKARSTSSCSLVSGDEAKETAAVAPDVKTRNGGRAGGGGGKGGESVAAATLIC